jgi:hypothetical protein
VPSFFLMKKTGEAIGDLDGRICPVSKFSLRKASNSFCSEGESGYTLQPDGFSPGTSSMGLWIRQSIKRLFGEDRAKFPEVDGYAF